MKNWSMRIFTILSLLLISGAAFAGSNNLDSSAVTNHTDLSISYLSQVFGTVGSSLQGTSGQMLGMLFYKFNQGILVVAGFWLSYLVFTTFLKSAHEGSFISPNRNIVIILLRVALGFGLLLPNPTTGYSIFQDILMKVVVSGVSLADQTWDYGLKYLDNGGQVWRTPSSSSNGQGGLVNPTQAAAILGGISVDSTTPFGSLGRSQQIFLDEVCMYAAGGATNSVIEDDTKSGSQFVFPGATANDPKGCGSVGWTSNTYSAKNLAFVQQGASSMVYALLPAAKRFVCANISGVAGCGGDVSSTTADMGNAFFSSLINFANAVMPATEQQGGEAAASRAFIEDAKQGGWMLSGRYYWDLSQVVSNFNQAEDITTFAPNVKDSSYDVMSGNPDAVTKAINTAKSQLYPITSTALTMLSNYSQSSSSGGVSQNAPAINPGALANMPSVVAAMLFPYEAGLNDIVGTFSTAKGSGFSYDPILFLHNIGMQCMNEAGSIWFGTSLILLAMSAVTIFCQSVVNLNSILQTLSGWVKPFMMTMAILFLGIGFTLGYYVPLYPYMLFTFGVIGWIIRVIVGMAAAPLVCLGLTHPEGHDFLGQAQQLLTLLLSVFIEPVLMVIGLFAGMILSYVSLRILIYTFSGFISDLFVAGHHVTYGTPPALLNAAVAAGNNFSTGVGFNGGMLALLTFPLMLIIFASIVYTVTNKCFSVIHELPHAAMQWIGGPNMQGTAAQMAESVGGAMKQAGQSIGKGIEGSMGGFDKGVQKGSLAAGKQFTKSWKANQHSQSTQIAGEAPRPNE